MALAASVLLLAATPVLAQQGPPGELDPTFGSAGKLTTDFFASAEEINAVAPLSDGRFVVAGTVVGRNLTGPGSSPNFSVARYLPDGRLDPSFGTAGLVHLDRSGNVDEAHALKLLPDRSLLVFGILANTAYSDFALLKLRPDGSADTTFGDAVPGTGARTGAVLLDVAGANFHDEGRHLAVQRDGKIVVAGNTLVVVGNFRYRRTTVARFSADGVLDTSFGGNGSGYRVLDGFFAADPQTSDYVSGIATNQRGDLPADDSITLVGYTFARNNAFATRLTRDGATDTSFGNQGRVLFSAISSGGVASGVSDLRAARIDNAGRLVLVGSGNDRGLAFLRLLPNGSPDTNFGTNGRTLVKLSSISNYDEARALALQGNGKIVASGYATTAPAGSPQPDFFVVRLTAEGQPDPTFGDGQGRKAVNVITGNEESRALAVEPSGNLLVAGYAAHPNASHTDFAVLRAYGDPDRIFADDAELKPF
ncbi:hypothetical protein [Tahibacter sp.]|uniref:hypothetical protein n=1 Tax=Tahibacter sp. TaxID=2056211 RepID=UPI0028C4DF79|nr:hypothetical protein [Tahibacter sp.]